MRAPLRLRPLFLPLLCALAAGCPNDQEAADAGAQDLRRPDDLACFKNPVTHVEIMNACTTSQAIDKAPRLPLLRPDGTLPPLP